MMMMMMMTMTMIFSGQIKNKDFTISCQSFYVKNTLGTVTCVVDTNIFSYQCNPPPDLLQVVINNDRVAKCKDEKMGDTPTCHARKPADGVITCVIEHETIVKYSCHFNATERFEGRSAICHILCKNVTVGLNFRTLDTEKCHLKFGTPPNEEPQPTLEPPVPPSQPTEAPPGPSTRGPPKKKPSQGKKFPLMAFLIACAIAGVIVLVACLTWRKCRTDERDSEPNAEGGTMAEGTELQTDASGWTEPTTATTGLIEQEKETRV